MNTQLRYFLLGVAFALAFAWYIDRRNTKNIVETVRAKLARTSNLGIPEQTTK